MQKHVFRLKPGNFSADFSEIFSGHFFRVNIPELQRLDRCAEIINGTLRSVENTAIIESARFWHQFQLTHDSRTITARIDYQSADIMLRSGHRASFARNVITLCNAAG